MRADPQAPLVHLTLSAGIGVAFVVGGQVTVEAWGTVPVRPLAVYVALATLVHAASRWTSEHGLAVRGAAWLVLASMPLHLTTLLRPEVLAPIVALALVDLARHRAEGDVEDHVPVGTAGKAVAGLATLGLLGILAVLVPLAKSTGILVRVGVVVALAWGLVTMFALRPATRSPPALLAGAGAFALTFGLLAGPVVPLGPLATYWVTLVAVTAAVLAATFSASDRPLRAEHRVHEQTVRSLPDPAIASLADRVRDVVAGSEDETSFSRRLEAALGRQEEGRLLAEATRREQADGVPEPVARQRALARLLDVELDDGGRP